MDAGCRYDVGCVSGDVGTPGLFGDISAEPLVFSAAGNLSRDPPVAFMLPLVTVVVVVVIIESSLSCEAFLEWSFSCDVAVRVVVVVVVSPRVSGVIVFLREACCWQYTRIRVTAGVSWVVAVAVAVVAADERAPSKRTRS